MTILDHEQARLSSQAPNLLETLPNETLMRIVSLLGALDDHTWADFEHLSQPR